MAGPEDRENVLLLPRPGDDCDFASIWDYAQRGRDQAFDGYDHAFKFLGRDAADVANERLDEYRQTGSWRGTFEELRVCLFFEARRWRHFGADPEGRSAEEIRALVKDLRERTPEL